MMPYSPKLVIWVDLNLWARVYSDICLIQSFNVIYSRVMRVQNVETIYMRTEISVIAPDKKGYPHNIFLISA